MGCLQAGGNDKKPVVTGRRHPLPYVWEGVAGIERVQNLKRKGGGSWKIKNQDKHRTGGKKGMVVKAETLTGSPAKKKVIGWDQVGVSGGLAQREQKESVLGAENWVEGVKVPDLDPTEDWGGAWKFIALKKRK